jgi:hypothetical protein
LIIEILQWDPKSDFQKSLHIWMTDFDKVSTNQYLLVENFGNDLQSLDDKMNVELDQVLEYWSPLIYECNPDGIDELKGLVGIARQNYQIESGKSAYTYALSTSARNSFLYKTVIEFVTCASQTTTIFQKVQLLETEVIVANESSKLREEYTATIKSLKKDLEAEFSALRLATKRWAIERRAKNATDIISTIKSCKYV